MVLIFLVFCVVVFGGVPGVHLFSFLCCDVWGGGGSVVLIFLVFCVVVFGGASAAHLFSFLCCSIWWGPWYSSF